MYTTTAKPLAPSFAAFGFEVIGLAILAVVTLGIGFNDDPVILNATNAATSVCYAGLLACGAVLHCRRRRSMLFTAPIWFRISAAMFYGFGNLVPLIADFNTRVYLESFAPLDSATLLHINQVVCVGTLLVLLGIDFADRVLPKVQTQQFTGFNSPSLGPIALSLGGFGFAVKYFLLVPQALGLLGGLTLPAAVSLLAFLPPVSIFLLTVWATARGRGAMAVPIGLLLLECASGVILGNKSTVILSCLMFGVGILATHFTVRNIVLVVVGVAISYAVIVPPTDMVRREMAIRYGQIDRGSLEERIAVLSDPQQRLAITRTQTTGAINPVYARFAYVYAAGFAINQHDQAAPGQSYRYFLAVLVPRVLWPDKPVITDVGVDFNEAAVGNRGSSAGPGVIAESYWNFGWLGVLVFMPVLGLFLLLWGRYGIWVVESGQLFLMPAALIAMRMGMRSDGFMVADIIGGSILVLALHVLIVASLGIARGLGVGNSQAQRLLHLNRAS
jgi:hypothetical protein